MARIINTDKMMLDSGSKVLREILECRIIGGKREPCESKFAEFDDATFKVVVPDSAKNMVSISLGFLNMQEILRLGADAEIEKLYPGMRQARPEEGFGLTLLVDMDQPPAGITPEEFVKRLCEVKKNVLAGPLQRAVDAMLAGTQASHGITSTQIRKNERTWICTPESDRIYIIFSVAFTDPTDQILARTFLQQFQNESGAAGAPLVSFGRDPPVELSGVEVREPPSCIGYVRFALLRQHVDSSSKRERSVELLTGFRNYLHYHTKASRTYLHMRMRRRVNGLLQVLHRAIQNPLLEGASA